MQWIGLVKATGIWIIKADGLRFGIPKLIAGGRSGKIKVDSGIFGHTEILIGAAILHPIKGLSEHGVMGFFPV